MKSAVRTLNSNNGNVTTSKKKKKKKKKKKIIGSGREKYTVELKLLRELRKTQK